jgi:hypothetical protein
MIVVIIGILLISVGYAKRHYLFAKFQAFERALVNETKDLDMKSMKNKGKILFSFLQIISSMPTALNLAYPTPFDNVLEVSSFSNVNVVNLLSFGCVVDVNFYDELW